MPSDVAKIASRLLYTVLRHQDLQDYVDGLTNPAEFPEHLHLDQDDL